jgi:hypothetical protein
MFVMGRSPSMLSTAAAAGVLAAIAVGPALARATTTTTTTTTTTHYRPPSVYTPTVAPNTIDNRRHCGHSTTATISTETQGNADHVTFRIQLGGRTMTLAASGSGSRWQAVLDGESFGYDHGSGTVRADASGPGGNSPESGSTSFTVANCPA